MLDYQKYKNKNLNVFIFPKKKFHFSKESIYEILLSLRLDNKRIFFIIVNLFTS